MAGGEGEGVRCPSTGRCRADDTVDGYRRDSFLGPYAGRWPSRGHERWRWNPRRALLVSPPLWGQTPSPQLCRQTDGQSACAVSLHYALDRRPAYKGTWYCYGWTKCAWFAK